MNSVQVKCSLNVVNTPRKKRFKCTVKTLKLFNCTGFKNAAEYKQWFLILGVYPLYPPAIFCTGAFISMVMVHIAPLKFLSISGALRLQTAPTLKTQFPLNFPENSPAG